MIVRKKKMMGTEEDRLSDLPDSILVHILSMLSDYDSKQIVRTSLLSTRWRSLWMSVPVSVYVKFPGNNDTYSNRPKKSIHDLLASTHRELHYWRFCEKIRKFNVFVNFFPSLKEFVKDIDVWVCFATKIANVEDFELQCESEYKFPQFAYNNSSWRKLVLGMCRLNPLGSVNWSSLVSLSFRYMHFEHGVLEKVLSGCPNLEYLELYCFGGFHRLDINSVKLKILILDNSEMSECDVWIEILAPYIQNLQVLGGYRGIWLRNLDSLVTAVLDFEFDFDSDFDSDSDFEDEDPFPGKEYTCLNEVLCSVAHVENLELGRWCVKRLSVLELEGWQPPPSSWKLLKLNTDEEQSNLPGIRSFLENSSYLETLIIDWAYYRSKDLLSKYITNEDERIRRDVAHSYNSSFLHLKTIKFINFFHPHNNELGPSLVKYLLMHATVLEKFTIATRCTRRDVSKHCVKIEGELLSFPRSSPHASVIFSYR